MAEELQKQKDYISETKGIIEINNQGLNCYLIKAGTTLYRADTPGYVKNKNNINTNSMITPGQPYYFGLFREEVDEYGIVFEYALTRDIIVIAVDDKENLQTNLAQHFSTEPEIIKIMNDNFGANTFGSRSDPRAIRESVKEKDFKLLNALCDKFQLGYGCIYSQFKDPFRGTFHSEIALCATQTPFLEFRRIMDNQLQIEFKIETFKLWNLGTNLDNSRKKGRKVSESPPNFGRRRVLKDDDADDDADDAGGGGFKLNFGDDDEAGGGGLFSGGVKRHKKTNKRRNKKTNKKTNKRRNKKTNKKRYKKR